MATSIMKQAKELWIAIKRKKSWMQAPFEGEIKVNIQYK